MDKSKIIVLDRGEYTTCTVNLQGATVTSWRINNEEQLFVSRQSQSHEHVPGGIQLIFPHFGVWNFGPKHGFAGTLSWVREEGPERMESGDIFALFSLSDDFYTQALWGYRFRLLYKITLCKSKLMFKICVENLCETSPFNFHVMQQALFRVPDVSKCEIVGLKSCSYKEGTRDDDLHVEDNETVTFSGYTNRMYMQAPGEVTVQNMMEGKMLKICRKMTKDINLWNPGVKRSASITNLGTFGVVIFRRGQIIKVATKLLVSEPDMYQERSKHQENIIILDRGDYTSCTINLHGAAITSWKIENQEMIFVSRYTEFSDFSHIPGGIQFVFPVLGNCVFGPKDGFVNLMPWKLDEGPTKLKSGDVYALISLSSNPYTRSLWNFKFKLYYKITLRENSIVFDIRVENPNRYYPLEFDVMQNALMKVPDVSKCEVVGLTERWCKDLANNTIYQDQCESITFSGNINRVYYGAPQEVLLKNMMKGSSLKITKLHSRNINLWDSRVDPSVTMNQSEDNDEYQRFIGVGAGIVSAYIEPLSCWAAFHIFEFIDLIGIVETARMSKNFYEFFDGFC